MASIAVFGSAAVFAVVHPALSALPVFTMGVLTALLMHKTGRLVAPIASLPRLRKMFRYRHEVTRREVLAARDSGS